jgi:hypothetical protein
MRFKIPNTMEKIIAPPNPEKCTPGKIMVSR